MQEKCSLAPQFCNTASQLNFFMHAKLSTKKVLNYWQGVTHHCQNTKEFHTILYGQKIEVHTNHFNLAYKKQTIHRDNSVRLLLEEYEVNINYIKDSQIKHGAIKVWSSLFNFVFFTRSLSTSS